MKPSTKLLQLDYLTEYRLGASSHSRRRNVPLRHGNARGLEYRLEYFNHSTFAWRLARQLEGREDEDDAKGIWPINCWRCEKKLGIPGSDIFLQGLSLKEATASVYSEAREMRRPFYFRAANAIEAKRLIREHQQVRYATEITSEWYDPPDGKIPSPASDSLILGSHAVPLIAIEDGSDGEYFLFPNSWGPEWGHDGFGTLSLQHFERFMIEAWFGFSAGLFVPNQSTTGIICLEWKWSLNDTTGVHGREIIDAATSEPLAWAFCCRRDGFLDIEEFYVWPTERGKGYGHTLASMVKSLASNLGLPTRLLVSYADTEAFNLENLNAAAKLLDVELCESGLQFSHLVGVSKAPVSENSPRRRPERPAFMLELLRPKDETPIEKPVDYSVIFGTNRKQIHSEALNPAFSAERGSSLVTGIAKVRIPKTHKFGSKGNTFVKFWNWMTKNNPSVTESKVFSDEPAFAQEIQKMMGLIDGKKHNLLYVHGFNVTFESAAIQAAYFGVDLKIPGATFVFSWPSAGQLKSYMSDEAAVEACLPYFDEFVKRILKSSEDVPLSIIVHSMGNRAVIRFLDSISKEQENVAHGRIENVIFAAPDVDTEVFKDLANRITLLPACTTLYATRADIALQASEWLHEYHRAGLAPPVITVPKMDTVLVEGFDWLNLGHGYYAEASSILHDMFIMIHYGAKPGGRPALTSATTLSGESYWKLQV